MAEPLLRSLKGIYLPKLQGCNGSIVSVGDDIVSSNCPQDRYHQDDHRKNHLLGKDECFQ